MVGQLTKKIINKFWKTCVNVRRVLNCVILNQDNSEAILGVYFLNPSYTPNVLSSDSWPLVLRFD